MSPLSCVIDSFLLFDEGDVCTPAHSKLDWAEMWQVHELQPESPALIGSSPESRDQTVQWEGCTLTTVRLSVCTLLSIHPTLSIGYAKCQLKFSSNNLLRLFTAFKIFLFPCQFPESIEKYSNWQQLSLESDVRMNESRVSSSSSILINFSNISVFRSCKNIVDILVSTGCASPSVTFSAKHCSYWQLPGLNPSPPQSSLPTTITISHKPFPQHPTFRRLAPFHTCKTVLIRKHVKQEQGLKDLHRIGRK